jgi:DNA invertase Pin-like site-specific DNA recombinase
MDAQRTAVTAFLRSRTGTLLGEFEEVETGKRKDRPELEKAVALCRKTKATLLIAKLDRLARNAAFTLALRDSGVEFVAADTPDANRLTIGILAVVAEDEAHRISERTRAGLAEAKRRGTKLGNPHPEESLRVARQVRTLQSRSFATKLAPVVREIQQTGVTTLAELADCLNRRGYRTPTGKIFYPQSVKNLLSNISAPRLV